MKILQGYILRRVGILSVAAFMSVLGVVWVSQALTRIDFATGSGQSILAFLQLLMYLTPKLAMLVLPFAVLIGVVQVCNTMNGDSELVVISASGGSRGLIAAPALGVALSASLVVFLSNNLVEPYANRNARDLVTAARSDLIATVIQEGQFRNIDQGLTVYIDRRLPGNQLSGIMLSDKRDPEMNLLYYAENGSVEEADGNDVLLMSNGQIHRENRAEDSVSIIRFRSYAVSLSQFASASGGAFYYPRERPTADLLWPDPNDKLAKNWPGWVRGEFHRRMSDWLYPVLFALVGLVVAGQTRSHRQARTNAFVLSLSAALFYRWGAYAIFNANRHNPELWWLFYALPLVAITVCLLMYRFGITLAVPDSLARRAATLRSLPQRAGLRLSRAGVA